MPRSNKSSRPIGLRLHIEAPLLPNGQAPTKRQIGEILRRSMDRAEDGYPLPRGMRVTIQWRNGNKGRWRSGEWSQEMTDSLNGRSGSIGWHALLEEHLTRFYS